MLRKKVCVFGESTETGRWSKELRTGECVVFALGEFGADTVIQIFRHG